jgi:hypothetical protein
MRREMAMGWNDRIDQGEEDRKAFLRQLIDGDRLEDAALGITKLVIDKGDDVLSEKQKFVFKRDVLDVYVIRECSRGGCDIPWSEMMMAYDNGGLCGYCAHMHDKIMRE